MVTTVTSLGRNGLHDWIIQRVTALVLAAWVLYMLGFLLAADQLNYATWLGLFAQDWFKIFSFLAVAAVVFHAWVGLWIVSTDYLKPVAIRLVFQVAVILLCLAFLLWGAQILWSV